MGARTFKKSTVSDGWPDPVIQPSEVKDLSNSELADYLAACTFEYDGTSSTVREALVRLLRASPT